MWKPMVTCLARGGGRRRHGCVPWRESTPFTFLILVVPELNTHFQSWIESYLLPTFCQVFPRASSCSFSFDPTKGFLTLPGTLQTFLKSPSSRALAGFLKGQHHPSASFNLLWFLLNGNPPTSPSLPLSLSSLEIGSLEKGNGFGPRLASPLKDRHAFAKEKFKKKKFDSHNRNSWNLPDSPP